MIGLIRVYLEKRPCFFPLASYPLFFPLTFYIAHTSLRLRHPIDPVLALLLAIAILDTRSSRTPEKIR
jgi:hypothetical protein